MPFEVPAFSCVDAMTPAFETVFGRSANKGIIAFVDGEVRKKPLVFPSKSDFILNILKPNLTWNHRMIKDTE